jgi:formiminotetrahydrofolate cyclodeaminase
LAAALSGAALEKTENTELTKLARPFLDAVAGATPTPGGGSVSAFAGAAAAALGQMVAGLSRKKKSQAAFVDQLSGELDALRKTGEALTAAIDRDAHAYAAVMRAFKMPQTTPEEIKARKEAVQEATKGAHGGTTRSGRTDSYALRTIRTTAGYVRGIHAFRLGRGGIDGGSWRARGPWPMWRLIWMA